MPEPASDTHLYKTMLEERAVIRSSCRVHTLWLIIPFLILLSLQVGLAFWIVHRLEGKPHVTVVIDMNGTQQCAPSLAARVFPCIANAVYTSSEDPIGPLKCRDDAFEESGGPPDSCHGNAFRIASDGRGVVIPEDGLYRVYAKVTFFDKENHHTGLSVRIDPPHLSGCLGNHACLATRNSRAHAWLACHSHQPPSAAKGIADFAGCAIDGIRRFAAGETVGMQVDIGYRDISGHHKSTYMYLHKL